ncbi:unnamed protein product [Mesocestoides corti]|uniref:Atos-like conserved domain-containing protein n=1 Tax=Mesocestoides corti TaxID=53468 RepID=A0A0R3UM92_MESCO|nr:unnamed protein product [Mesocestoides corti]
MGHPIIIEFLLLPASGIGSNNLGLACKRIPAFLVEQWMIQFLPKRLITGTYVDLSTLSSEISLHCAMSILNKIIFGDKSCRVASKAKSLRCVCRLTNLRDANVFSSCWFSLNASELDDKKSHFISTDFGFYLIRDFYDALSLPDDVHTTTRMKRPKRTYLCSSPCSHTHRQDTAEICTSRTFSRISASSEEFLDISVTSILEVPTTAPTELNLSSLRYLYNGTMSLPNKRMHEVTWKLCIFNTTTNDSRIEGSTIEAREHRCQQPLLVLVLPFRYHFALESMLNGRIPPAGMVDGFTLEIGASGSFFPPHVKLPVVAYFFQLSDDDKTPSPYLGHVDLTGLSNKRGYHVPRKGSIQLTLFNPSDCVMKVFVIQYNLEDMPPNSQTFLRQRTVYMPVSPSERTSVESESAKLPSDLVSCVFNGKISEPQRLKLPAVGTGGESLPVFLRYLVHLRFHTTKSSNLYLHTDIRLIFARNTFEFDPRVAAYRMRSFLDGPTNPRFSPKAC